mmetsp:Transcript_32591/g.103915  ORF Transcript_32591/g.103915 Transcript_32591/m.103915 type:complete len:181 (+) Transcript_32591:812-1354(+)
MYRDQLGLDRLALPPEKKPEVAPSSSSSEAAPPHDSEVEVFERLLLTDAGLETMPVRDAAAEVMANVLIGGDDAQDEDRSEVRDMILKTMALRDEFGPPEDHDEDDDDETVVVPVVKGEEDDDLGELLRHHGDAEELDKDDSSTSAVPPPFDDWAEEIPDFDDIPEFDLDKDGSLVVTSF